ncbi:uncharacterized protein ACNLHF_024448 [Anomaloglossus baeobatrachus]|uniref:uncharacterized protein LOC142243678 n=1 Tax=Anomaloglossus baeobatrachus TaxID=238106 RepID=UPI003F505FC2
MAEGRVVEVSGLPHHQYDDDDLIRDKLLIHFLKVQNGGNGEVIAHYPTEKAGVALLEFKDEKVAKSILSRKHNLMIRGRSHPLEVRHPRSSNSQFSMPIMTNLDLSHFRSVSEVKRILERHMLRIYRERGLVLSIKGDFCDLGRCRLDLYEILEKEEAMEKQLSSLQPTGRKLSSEEMGARAPQNVPPTPERKSSLSSHLNRQQPYGGGHLAQDNIPRDTKSPTQHSSPKTSPRETPTRKARAMTPTRDRKVSEPVSFLVDGAVCRYVTVFQREVMNSVLRQYNVDMNEEHNEGFTTITLTPRPPEETELFTKACDEIQAIFDNYYKRLREDNIELTTNSKEEITKIQDHLHKRDIFSFLTAPRSLTIIGPSEEILNFLQKWKGTRGKMAENNMEMSGPPRSSMIGTESKNVAKISTQPGASDGRSGVQETGHDTWVRGKPRDAAGRGAPSPTHIRKLSEPVSFTVDTDVYRCVSVFYQQMIDSILTQYNIDINEEHNEGFTTLTLTPRPPGKPELFTMACDEIKTIFDNYHKRLREDKIELTTDSQEEIFKIRDHLLKRDIYSFHTAPRSLTIIGPSGEILNFLQEWKGTGGKMAENNIEKSGSPRPSMMGTNSKNLVKTSTQPGASDGRSGGRETGHDTRARGKQQDAAGRGAPSPTHIRKVSEPVSFTVDTDVYRYVTVFQRQMIDSILTQYNININEENREGFTTITLTPRPPGKPEVFTMACDEVQSIFHKYYKRLRADKIELTTDLKEEMIEIQNYLLKRDIYSFHTAPRSLTIIGPSGEILNFLQEWKGTGGKMAENNIEKSGSPRPSMMGTNSKNLVKTSTQPGASDGRSGGRETGHDTRARGKQQDAAGRGAPSPTLVRKVSEPVSFTVDTDVYRYVTMFQREMIDLIVAQYNIDINEEHRQGFTIITLTPRPPGKPEVFTMACDEIQSIFDNYYKRLRADKIELMTKSQEEISEIQNFLLKRDIYSFYTAPRSLTIIGPSGEILNFLQEWKGTGGKMAEHIIETTGSPRSSTMGKDSKNLAKTSTQPEASHGRSGGRETGHDTRARGKQQNAAGSGRRDLSGNRRR